MKFWVGDPCYHKGYDWDDYLNESNYGEDVAEIDGRYIAASNTMYGDGTYEGSNGMNYPVDAGLLGVVEWKDGDVPPFGMTIEEFDSRPFVDINSEGLITISDGKKVIYIMTGDESSDEDEEDWSYYDEDTEID